MKSVGIIGAGTMGQGIAQVAALSDFKVLIHDSSNSASENVVQKITEQLKKGIKRGKLDESKMEETIRNISLVDSLDHLKADLIIEAIVEDLAIKQQVLKKVQEINGASAMVVSNTSSIPITRIARTLPYPEQFAGLHFFNPAHIMQLVEVIKGASTSDQTIDRLVRFVKKIDKTAVFANDSPGFIVNRVARHFYVESLKVLEDKVAHAETIDRLIESTGFKMGPFRLMDLIGVDTNYKVTTTMYKAFHYDPKFRPSRIQESKVDAGEWGRKSGRGFYSYE